MYCTCLNINPCRGLKQKLSYLESTGKVRSIQCSLAAVNDDVFWHDASLQHAHFGMVPTTSEETGGLNLEVGNPLFVVVHHTVTIFLQ